MGGSGEDEMTIGVVCLSPCAWFGDIMALKDIQGLGMCLFQSHRLSFDRIDRIRSLIRALVNGVLKAMYIGVMLKY